MKKILVVEDDSDIREYLQTFLTEGKYEVLTASDGVEAISIFQQHLFDLILMDIMLPKIDGYQVCEVIRKQSTVPIIMLTALEDETHQLQGFDLQIDDYITKPFSMPILMKKIEAILRRMDGVKEYNPFLSYGEIKLDLESYQIFASGKEIELTRKEFEIIKELIQHKGKVMTREMLMTKLWEYDYLGDIRIVDTHIKNIRKKIKPNYIETIRGVGYRIPKEIKE